MKKTIFFALVLCCVFCFASSEAFAISWTSDLSKAIEDASGNGKPIMVDFYTDWCGWCKKLDADTYSDKTVEDTARQFICVKVNADKERALTGKYGVRGFPTIIFLNSKGAVADQVVGYVNAPVLKQAMDKVLKNNPASRSAAADPAIPAAERPKELFRLGGIMGNSAIVNDRVVRVGDVVNSGAIMEITSNSVKINHKGKEIVLSLE